jgi:hypothetical protein
MRVGQLFPTVLWSCLGLSMTAYLIAHGAAMGGGASRLLQYVPGAVLTEVSLIVLCFVAAATSHQRSGSYRLLCMVTGVVAFVFGLGYFVPFVPFRLLNPMQLPLHLFGLVLPFIIGIAGLWGAGARREP